ncbi:MAG: hypothetical protein ACI30V_08910 [Muribaculaceae bacterium]
MAPSLIIIVAVAAILLVLLIMFFTYNNKEIYLRKEADAQRKKIESTHDKMWKVIKQKAEVSDKYRETFERVYPEIIAGRYSDGSSAMKWIQEANPNFDIADGTLRKPMRRRNLLSSKTILIPDQSAATAKPTIPPRQAAVCGVGP